MSLFRYPGSKSRLLPVLTAKLKFMARNLGAYEYREPFFGAGSVGLRYLECRPPAVWFNDYDPAIACVWNAVASDPERLKSLVRGFTPTTAWVYENKTALESLSDRGNAKTYDYVDLAFRKIALHQTTYSGLGVKSGGPLGGKSQKSRYPVGCRWSPGNVCKDIDRIHRAFRGVKFRCTSRDFSELIAAAGPCLLYLDPPYYDRGPALYQFSFAESQHVRLAELLKASTHPWVLSYDDHERVRELYSWATVEEVSTTYTLKIATDRASKSRELLITP